MSAGGSVPESACSAAAATPSREAPASACSTALARSGTWPMFVNPTRALPIVPLPDSTTAATPTVAQSSERCRNLTYDQPAAPVFGTRTSTISSFGVERRLEEAAEALARAEHALAAGTARDDLRVEREDDRGQVRGGVAVGERAADRAAVPDLWVADEPGRVREQRDSAPARARRCCRS